MSCEDCPKKFHPIFVILAILAWIGIIIGIVKLVHTVGIWLGWVNIIGLGVMALLVAFGKAVHDINEWDKAIRKG